MTTDTTEIQWRNEEAADLRRTLTRLAERVRQRMADERGRRADWKAARQARADADNDLATAVEIPSGELSDLLYAKEVERLSRAAERAAEEEDRSRGEYVQARKARRQTQDELRVATRRLCTPLPLFDRLPEMEQTNGHGDLSAAVPVETAQVPVAGVVCGSEGPGRVRCGKKPGHKGKCSWDKPGHPNAEPQEAEDYRPPVFDSKGLAKHIHHDADEVLQTPGHRLSYVRLLDVLPEPLAELLAGFALDTVGDLVDVAINSGKPLRYAMPNRCPTLRREVTDSVCDAVEAWLAANPPPAGPEIRRCRKCGCVETECAICYVRTGQACQWVEDDLCSACVQPTKPARGRRKRKESAE